MPSRTYTCYRLSHLPRGATSSSADGRVFQTPPVPPFPASVSNDRLFTALELRTGSPRVARHCRARMKDVWRPPARAHARYHQQRALRRDEIDAFLTAERLILHGSKEVARRAVRHFRARAPARNFPALEIRELDIEKARRAFPHGGPTPQNSEAVTLSVPYKDERVEVLVTRRGRFVFTAPQPAEIAVGVVWKVLGPAGGGSKELR